MGGDGFGRIESELAMAESQGLLREDALIAAITFFDEGGIEGGEKEVAIVVGVEQVEASSGGLGLIGGWDRRTTL